MWIRIRCYVDQNSWIRISLHADPDRHYAAKLYGWYVTRTNYGKRNILFSPVSKLFFSNICWIRKYPFFRPPREYLFTVLPPPLATQEKHQHPPGICCPTTNIIFSFSLLLLQQKRLCDVQLLLWPYCMAIYFCLSFLFSFLYLFTASEYTVWFGTYVGVLAINLPKMFVTQSGKMKYIIRLGRFCQCDFKKLICCYYLPRIT